MRAALVLLAALALLEAGLRWGAGFGDPPVARLDPVTEYELTGPAEHHRFGRRIALNGLGLRAGAPGAGPRILLTGDSVVYGDGLDQSETVAARLDAALAACGAQTLPVAVSSWGPVNQAAWLAREGLLEARTAAMVVSAHDLTDLPRPGTAHIPDRLRRPPGAIADAVIAVLRRLRPDPAPRDTPDAAGRTLAALAAMTAQMRAAGIEPVLVYHPTRPERRDGPRPERAVFFDWAAGQGVGVLDLGAVPMGAGAYRDAIHPSAEGAAAIAAALAPRLAPPGC